MLRHRLALLFSAAGAVGLGCANQSATESSVPADRISETCEHVVEVVEPSRTQAEASTVEVRCQAVLSESAAVHAKLTSCMLSAATIDDVDACERARAPHDSVLGPTNEVLCEHVFGLMTADWADDATQPSQSYIDEFKRRCPSDLERERVSLGPAKWREQTACVMTTTTIAEFLKCDSPEPEWPGETDPTPGTEPPR